MSVHDLPDECLGRVLALAGREQGPALLLVCRRWHDVFWTEPALWQHLEIRAPSLPGYPRDLEREARWLADRRRLLERVVPLLRTVVFHDGGPTTPFGPVQLASLLPILAAAPALERLERLTHRLTEADVAALEGCTQLTALSVDSFSLPLLPRRQPTAVRLALLPAKLPALRSLALKAAKLPDAVIESVLRLAPTLTNLVLHTVVEPLPAADPLRGLPHLQRLSLVDDSFDGSREPPQLPAPAGFPALQQYRFNAMGRFQLAGVQLGSLALQDVRAGKPALVVNDINAGATRWWQFLQAAIPCGWQPHTLCLGECLLDGLLSALQHSPAVAAVAGLQELHVDSCRCEGGMDAPLGALLRRCSASLTSLVFYSVEQQDEYLLRQLPPALVACAQLQSLILHNGNPPAQLQLPSGAYLTGLITLSTNALASLPPALATASALVLLSLSDCSLLRLLKQDLELLPTESLKVLWLPDVSSEEGCLLDEFQQQRKQMSIIFRLKDKDSAAAPEPQPEQGPVLAWQDMFGL